MKYPHRYYLFVAAADLPALRAMLAALWPCDPKDCPAAFGTPLSQAADPTGPVVYHCGSFVCTEGHRQALEAAEAGGHVPASLRYCRCDAATGEVKTSNDPWGQTRVGKTFDLALTLSTLGLAFHRPAPVT